MVDELLVSIISNVPNFIGLVLLAAVLREMSNRQWAIIERVLENCVLLEQRLDALAGVESDEGVARGGQGEAKRP